MLDIEKDGLTQRIITDITGVSSSTVSKYIVKHGFTPLPTGQVKNVRYASDVARRIITDLSKNFLKPKLKKHCFYNFKGGTGKTSICFHVSSIVSLMGYKVLVLDLDPQGHLSTSHGFGTEDKSPTMYDKIVQNINFKSLIRKIYDGYDCVPSNLSLSRIEQFLGAAVNREKLLTKVMVEIENNYDFIFIDMNPSINLLNWNVITYCDVINIVSETQPYSVNSIKLLLEELTNFYRIMDIPERKIHIIPNKYEERASSTAESMTLLKRHYEKYMKPEFAVRKSEDINTGAKLGKPLPYFSKKNSVAFEDLFELAKYIIEISA